MFCPKCGTQNEDSGNFCVKCSNPLHAGALAGQPVNQPDHPQQNYQQPGMPTGNQQGYPQQNYQQPGMPTGNQPGYPQQNYQQPGVPTGNQQGYPQQNYQQPGYPSGNPPASGLPTRPASKKNPALIALIAVVGLVVAFFVWAAVSPDTPPVDSDAQMIADGDAPLEDEPGMQDNSEADAAAEADLPPVDFGEEAEVAILDIGIANSPEEAEQMVRFLKGDENYVFLREENFVGHEEEGILTIDVNTPELANTPCYVISPSQDESGGYGESFVVIKGTDQVFYTKDFGDTFVPYLAGE